MWSLVGVLSIDDLYPKTKKKISKNCAYWTIFFTFILCPVYNFWLGFIQISPSPPILMDSRNRCNGKKIGCIIITSLEASKSKLSRRSWHEEKKRGSTTGVDKIISSSRNVLAVEQVKCHRTHPLHFYYPQRGIE